MRAIVNGKPREVPENATVNDLILRLELDPRFVIVEHNGEPLVRRHYEQVRLAEGDRIELVRAVAGG